MMGAAGGIVGGPIFLAGLRVTMMPLLYRVLIELGLMVGGLVFYLEDFFPSYCNCKCTMQGIALGWFISSSGFWAMCWEGFSDAIQYMYRIIGFWVLPLVLVVFYLFQSRFFSDPTTGRPAWPHGLVLLWQAYQRFIFEQRRAAANPTEQTPLVVQRQRNVAGSVPTTINLQPQQPQTNV